MTGRSPCSYWASASSASAIGIEGEVVGVLDAARAGDLDAQRQAGRVVLLLAELEDALDRLRGDGEHHQIGGRGGVGHGIRLTSGVVTDTPSTEPNEGHGPEVLYEVADHVATITLNRPHRRNAISGRMLELLSELLRPGRRRRRRARRDPHRRRQGVLLRPRHQGRHGRHRASAAAAAEAGAGRSCRPATCPP